MGMAERKRIGEQKDLLLSKLSGREVLCSAQSLTGPSSFILPYDPAEVAAASEVRDVLISDLAAKGIRAVDADIYDIALEVLDEEELYDDLVELEPTIDKARFTDALKDAVDVEDEIVPRVKARARGADLLFISGVGACFPFVRIHQLLENLSAGIPVVTFFPGDYRVNADGSTTLDILDIPQGQGGGFYRARNIYDL